MKPNRKPFHVQVTMTVELVHGQLTVAQLKHGMIEHYGDEITVCYEKPYYVVKHAGREVKRSTAYGRAAACSRIYEPSEKPSAEGKHGVAPRGVKELRESGWRKLGG